MNNIDFDKSEFKGMIIAIDGPAGSGKTTTAKYLAARLGFIYLDTGAMYRSLTYYALKNNISPSDEAELTKLANKLPIDFKTSAEVNHVFIDGLEVTDEIRTPEVTLHVSEVSAFKGVRLAMVARQKELGRAGSIVAEGRDTTTVVFPKADLKIYLSASVEERARRRLLDLENAEIESSLQAQIDDIERRDNHDSNRQHSPLTHADDATLVNTTDLSIDEQVDNIIELLRTVKRA